MSDPKRLFDGAGSESEQRLIGHARAELPPAGAVGRTLSVLGAAGGVLLPAASHAADLGAGAVGGGTAATRVTVLSVVKWLGAGIAGGLLTVAAARVVTLDATDATPSSTGTSPSASVQNGEPRLLASARAPAAASEPVLAAPSAAAPSLSSASSTLVAELALLERTRRALAEGRSGEARDLLARYRADFPSGALREEAEVLRIEVLFARGERDLSEQAARDFLATHATSPHAARIRGLLAPANHDPNRDVRPSNE